MKHYVKDLFDFTKQPVPSFMGQRETFNCPHCNKRVLVNVPPSGIDWETIAKKYEGYANQMFDECNQLLADAGLKTLLESRVVAMLVKLKKSL